MFNCLLWVKEILSTKGTTQGNPLAVAMYALAVIPLIKFGLLMTPLLWDPILPCFIGGSTFFSMGPDLWVFLNASKTVLIVKSEHFDNGESISADTNIQVTVQGQKYLGVASGPHAFAKICY